MTTAFNIWCQGLFESLADGGMWGVPRSGLIFSRRGNSLVLTETMPWEAGMPITVAEWVSYQSADYECIREEFAAAGIVVAREMI